MGGGCCVAPASPKEDVIEFPLLAALEFLLVLKFPALAECLDSFTIAALRKKCLAGDVSGGHELLVKFLLLPAEGIELTPADGGKLELGAGQPGTHVFDLVTGQGAQAFGGKSELAGGSGNRLLGTTQFSVPHLFVQ